MMDIVERLDDLIIQATKERSHYYVANCAKDASEEIKRLRRCLSYIRQVVEKAV